MIKIAFLRYALNFHNHKETDHWYNTLYEKLEICSEGARPV
ncbi:hypothetical protein [Elizabethkingia anophelis]|nr:hypothetical protein [Elizabethkingia anophelis]